MRRMFPFPLPAGLPGRTARPGADSRRWTLPLARPLPDGGAGGYGVGRSMHGQPRAPHRAANQGLDMQAETGEPVLAAAEGAVLFSGPPCHAANAVYRERRQGLATSLVQLSKRRVETGARAARGQVLGLAGAAGRSTGPHLHFGVWALGRLVDPEPLFLYDPLP